MSKITLPLKPYRSLGLFIGKIQPQIYTSGKTSYLCCSLTSSFKIYQLPTLKIVLISGDLPGDIQAQACRNDEILISILSKETGKQILYKFSFLHVQSKLEILQMGKCTHLEIIGSFFLAIYESQSSSVIEVRLLSDLSLVRSFTLGFVVNGLVHPKTYLNKILFSGEQEVELWNIVTEKRIYNFPILTEFLTSQESPLTILTINDTPALDIISFGLSNGQILLYNIKTEQVVLQFSQDSPVKQLSFAEKHKSIFASCEDSNVLIWDLQKKQLLKKLNLNIKGISYVEFLNDSSQILIGSEESNSLQIWSEENGSYSLLRQRQGMSSSPIKLKFKQEDPKHLIIATSAEQAEIFDFSLINESMSQKFSLKGQKDIREVIDFSFTENRQRDWAQLLTLHKNSNFPYIWNILEKSLTKLKLELDSQNQEKITAGKVTQCGNFAIIGYSSGEILKFNLQSGKQRKKFFINNQGGILFLHVDPYNKFLFVCTDNSSIILFDFFSCKFIKAKQLKSKIRVVKTARNSSLIGFGLENNTIEIWDINLLQKVRKKSLSDKNLINAMVFTPDSKKLILGGKRILIFWDLLSDQFLFQYKLKDEITSIDINPSGNLVAMSIKGKKEIQLWTLTNKISVQGEPIKVIFQSDIKECHSSVIREAYSETQNVPQSQDEKDQVYSLEYWNQKLESEQTQDQKTTFTTLPKSFWQPLLHWDAIKEKNRLQSQIMEEDNIEIPFFLDFGEKLGKKPKDFQQIEQEESKANSKIVNQVIEENIAKERTPDFEKGFSDLKKLNPSELDLEFKRLSFDYDSSNTVSFHNFSQQTSLQIKNYLSIFEEAFSNSQEFDLKSLYFSLFLKVSFFLQSCNFIKERFCSSYGKPTLLRIITPNTKKDEGHSVKTREYYT